MNRILKTRILVGRLVSREYQNGCADHGCLPFLMIFLAYRSTKRVRRKKGTVLGVGSTARLLNRFS